MDEETGEETVPKAQFLKRLNAKQRVIEQKDEAIEALKAELTEIKGQVASAPDPSKIEKRLQRIEAERDKIRDEFDAYRADQELLSVITAAGITDPEDVELVRYRHGRIPEGERPELAKWLEGAAKEDRYIGPLLGSQGRETQEEAPQAQTHTHTQPRDALPRGLPRVNGGAVTDAPAKPMSIEHIMKMTHEERVDPANRAAINKALGLSS